MLDANKWLEQAGIVKKLQIALAISICLNLFLCLSIIPKPSKKIAEAQEEIIEKEEKTISETKIKNFIKDYLNYFFGTGLVAKSFIEKHTENNFFENELAQQLESRTQKKLSSNFNVMDFYIEAIGGSNYKVILVGIESFENKDYQDREITMILVLEHANDSFIVQSIPQFDIKV